MNDNNANHRESINLHIEQLVLDGFPAQDHNRIVSAMQEKLHRLLSQEELPSIFNHSANIGRLDGGEIQAGYEDTAEAIGKQTARNIYGGIQQ